MMLTQEQREEICRLRYRSINYLIKLLHFNKDLPQYHNIYIPDKKFTHARVFDGEKFALKPLDDTLEKLFLRGAGNLGTILESTKVKPDIEDILLKVIDLIEDNDDAYMKQRKAEIKLLLYNNKKLPIQTHK